LDPSYKQYQLLPGLDPIVISGIDMNAAVQATLNSATVNEAEGWVSGIDSTGLQNVQTQMQTALHDYIGTKLTNPTVGDVIGGRKTIIEEHPILFATLPNRIVAVGARYGKLPAALQNTMTYAFGRDYMGELIDPLTLPQAKLNNQRLTLSFRPATADDEQALLSLLPQGQITDISQLPGSIPAYLVHVIPELKLNGQIIKTGASMRLGEEMDFISQVRFGGTAFAPNSYGVVAGSYLAVAAESGSISLANLRSVRTRLSHVNNVLDNIDQTLMESLTQEEILGELFYAGLINYYAQLNGISEIMGLAQKGHYILAAGNGTYGHEPDVNYLFGFPTAIKPGGVAMNVPMLHIVGESDNDTLKQKSYVLLIGMVSSALEHAVPEQMFVNGQNPGEGVSAVKALQKANAQGQRIYQITQANQTQTLPNIRHSSLVMQEIKNSLSAGKEIITHTDTVSTPGWSGAGYIIFDPQNGAGAFKIAGGSNGGFLKSLQTKLLFWAGLWQWFQKAHPVLAAAIKGSFLLAVTAIARAIHLIMHCSSPVLVLASMMILMGWNILFLSFNIFLVSTGIGFFFITMISFIEAWLESKLLESLEAQCNASG
jgi:hypothetical protein